MLLQQQINGHGVRFCAHGHFMLASRFSLELPVLSAQTRLEIVSRLIIMYFSEDLSAILHVFLVNSWI